VEHLDMTEFVAANMRRTFYITPGISRTVGERFGPVLRSLGEEGPKSGQNGGNNQGQNQQGGGDQNGTQFAGLQHQAGTPGAALGVPRHLTGTIVQPLGVAT
jgi:hypothetical protein